MTAASYSSLDMNIVVSHEVDIGVSSSGSRIRTSPDGIGLLAPGSLPFWYSPGCCTHCGRVSCLPTRETLAARHRACARCQQVWFILMCSPPVVVVIPICDLCVICGPSCSCLGVGQWYTPYDGDLLCIHALGASILLGWCLGNGGIRLELWLGHLSH